MNDIGEKVYTVKIHSLFTSAANLESELGLITILKPWKCLQPYSVVLESEFNYELLQRGKLSIDRYGIKQQEQRLISFDSAPRISLQIRRKPRIRNTELEKVKDFLAAHKDCGLVQLLFEENTNVYTQFLAPRIEEFRNAVKAGNENAVIDAVKRIAGCGPGLTPSSDDFLCGYLIGMLGKKQESWVREIAETAASKTNTISAALLYRAGEGYFSEDILKLLECLENIADEKKISQAIQKAAEFGSSSGCDFLTGLYLGMTDSYEIGGIGIEKTGN